MERPIATVEAVDHRHPENSSVPRMDLRLPICSRFGLIVVGRIGSERAPGKRLAATCLCSQLDDVVAKGAIIVYVVNPPVIALEHFQQRVSIVEIIELATRENCDQSALDP